LGRPQLDEDQPESPAKELCESFLTDLPEATTLNLGDGDDTFSLEPNNKQVINVNVQESERTNNEEDESMMKEHRSLVDMLH
jgi:hypothetical protein